MVRSSLSLSDVGADPAKWSVSENAGQKSCRGFYYKDHDGHVIELMTMP